MHIGKSIRVALAMREKNQKWLSEKLGVSTAYVSALCTNNTTAGTGAIKRISEALDFSVSEFVALGE